MEIIEIYDLVVIGSVAGFNVLNVGLQINMKHTLVENTKLDASWLTLD